MEPHKSPVTRPEGSTVPQVREEQRVGSSPDVLGLSCSSSPSLW